MLDRRRLAEFGVWNLMRSSARRALSLADPAPLIRVPTRGLRRAAAALWLALLLVLLLPAAAGAAGFSPEQRQEIEGIIKNYLSKNPELLLDALQAAEDKVKSQSQEKAAAALVARRQEVVNDPNTPVGGNPQGDVSLVEFFDYRCPYCKQVEPSLEALVTQDRQLRFVYKEFPVLGPASKTAARAALAARQQGKYAALHRALMALKGEFDDAAVYKTASEVGLDLDRLKHDMAAPEIDRDLKANIDLADALDIRGTPGFVIGDEIVPGAVSLDTLKQLIDAARHDRK
jgi:protein-disulfide isomerase